MRAVVPSAKRKRPSRSERYCTVILDSPWSRTSFWSGRRALRQPLGVHARVPALRCDFHSLDPERRGSGDALQLIVREFERSRRLHAVDEVGGGVAREKLGGAQRRNQEVAVGGRRRRGDIARAPMRDDPRPRCGSGRARSPWRALGRIECRPPSPLPRRNPSAPRATLRPARMPTGCPSRERISFAGLSA